MLLPRTERDCELPCTDSPLARRILQHPQRVCAWLERGGIFNTHAVPRPGKPLLYRRMKCLPDPGSTDIPCKFQWTTLDNPRAVTFKWIGTDGKSK
ncbi:unnamed protein product [Schistocephalus solidus]|uniref:Transposase n=1 Tax=Schistocephalus solidus TaxID=70667 RepID=A0A183TJ63_SCHSO|nr:unnamed protein product [Schistocephalus solidus]